MLNKNLSLSTFSSPARVSSGTDLVRQALRCLGLTLHFDYLSNGKGHQQTRNVLVDRFSRSSAEGSNVLSHTKLLKNSVVGRNLADNERSYLSKISEKKRLTSSEEYRLALRMQTRTADAICAEGELIEANLGLVVMFAYRYQRPGIPLMDIIAEGNFGLMTAAKRFDPELGYRFSTYAKWWIRQSIQLAMPKLSGVVRIPNSEANRRKKFLRSSNQSCMNEEIAVTTKTIESNLDLTPSDGAYKETEEITATETTFPVNDEDALALLAIDQDCEPPNIVMQSQRSSMLQSVLDLLSEREKIIITERYALLSDSPSTLDELSQRFQVSIERIRQIECAALKKLQKNLQLAGMSTDTM